MNSDTTPAPEGYPLPRRDQIEADLAMARAATRQTPRGRRAQQAAQFALDRHARGGTDALVYLSMAGLAVEIALVEAKP